VPVPEGPVLTPPGVFRIPEGPVRTPVDVRSAEASPGWNEVIYDSPLERTVGTEVLGEISTEIVQREISAEGQGHKKRSRTEDGQEEENSLKKLKT